MRMGATVIGAWMLLCTSPLAVPSGQTMAQTALVEAGAYLTSIGSRFGGVVLEERYLQQTTSRLANGESTSRELVSDLVLIDDEQWGWVEFRDVFSVDGDAVRDRQDRVVALFAEPDISAREQALKIVEEGARYNLAVDGVSFARTLNLPLAALRFLQPENQRRSLFERGRAETIYGRAVTVVDFRERDEPRLIATPDGAPASGTFWIEQGTGRVLRSRIQLSTRRGATIVSGRLQVHFAPVEALDLWLPGLMEEDYLLTDLRERQVATVSGRASYTNARRFGVHTETQVLAP